MILQNGKVFSFGWSADGQTGVGHYDSVSEATEAQGDVKGEKIVKIATSGDCVLALNGKSKRHMDVLYYQMDETYRNKLSSILL